MKKVIKKGVVIAAMLTASLGHATVASLSTIRNPTIDKVIKLNNVKHGHQLSIKDSRGIVLYKEKIKKNGKYSKEFDLTSLPNGNHFFELEKDVEIKTIPFNVLSNNVTFKKEEEKIIFKPIVHKKGTHVYVSRTSLDSYAISFKIYYEDHMDCIVSEAFENEKNMGRIFDFSKARKGKYKFIFKTEGRTFVAYLKV